MTTITLTNGAVTLDLPDDLIWEDEFTWAQVAQATERSITGALIVDAMSRNGGRPITLAGTSETAWISRADMLILKAWLTLPGQAFTLVVRGVTHSVIFDHGTADTTTAMAQAAVMAFSDIQNDDYYSNLRLRFLEINP